MIVKKKIPPEYFELISSGKKKFELRVADFDIKVGDTLLLEEYDPKRKIYTGRKLEKKVSYKFNFSLNQYGQKDLIEKHGLYVLQLED